MSDITKIRALIELTHLLLGPPRNQFPTPKNIKVFKDKLYSPDMALLGGYQCSGHAKVIGMLLIYSRFKFRPFSMMKSGKYHHIGQVYYKGKYIAIDPLFNQMFVNQNGKYASVEEIHKNWEYYKNQVGNNLIIKEYEKYLDTYRQYYDYTPINNKPSILLQIIKYLFNDDFIQEINLNRYLYYQIRLTFFYLSIICLYIILFTIPCIKTNA